MNKIKIAALAIIIVLLISLIVGSFYLYKEFKIYKTNTQNAITGPEAMQTFTKKEMKQALDSTAKSILEKIDGIKVRNVTTYTETIYKYHDTVKTTTQIRYDSVKGNYPFLFNDHCITVGGFIDAGKKLITINKREVTDTIDLFHYRKALRHFWFIRWNFYDVAGAYSRCKGDTLTIQKFYKRRSK